MKKMVFLFLLLFSFHICSQTYQYAILSDAEIGAAGAAENLSKIIADINSSDGISFVIAAGNITKNGSDKELDNAKQIFGNIKIPYLVIPGSNETESKTDLLHFKELLGDTKFFFRKNKDIHIGLNSSTELNSGHFSPEDLNWLEEKLKDSVSSENVFFYSYFPLNGIIDNWFKLSNILGSFKVKAAFSNEGEKNKIINLNGIPGISLNAEELKSPAYFLVGSKKDSIVISRVILDAKRQEKIVGVILRQKNYEVIKIDSVQFIDYDKSVTWNKELNTTFSSDLEVTENKIFAASENGNIYCFDLNGNQLWEYNTGETIISKPACYGEILCAATLEGDLITVNANTGNVIQVIGIGEPLTSQLLIVDVLNQGEKTKGVIAASASGKIYCYDINTLENIWENSSARGYISSLPLIIKDRIIFGSSDGFLYCLDSKSGILNWKWKDRNSNSDLSLSAPVSDGKNVFINAPDNLYAIDLLLGTIIWKLNLTGASKSPGISNDNEKLYVKGNKSFYIVSSKFGKLIRELKMNYGEDYSSSGPVEWSNNILMGTENGNVFLIDQKYNWKKLFFAGTSKLFNIKHIKDNTFAVSNNDGTIISFSIK